MSDLKIKSAEDKDKKEWNNFVIKNYPPVGAFMVSWEWAEFQKNLGRKTERHLITANDNLVGVFTLVYCNLPLGQSYGYAPRGPAIDLSFFNTEEKINELLKKIGGWVKKNIPQLIFLRLEPPLLQKITNYDYDSAIKFPNYYIQPRYNLAVNLEKNEEKILGEFHPSNRANVRKAEKKNVSVEVKENLTQAEWDEFFKIAKETSNRNNGKNIFPGRTYFETMQKTAPFVKNTPKNELSLCFFYGKYEDKTAAINLVLFFGDTATYLFGASATASLPSKITTYLHWCGMKESKKIGYKYYDLGGIDKKLWGSLTIFKRRFKGEEFEYIGNADIIIKPVFYKIYNIIRKIKKSI